MAAARLPTRRPTARRRAGVTRVHRRALIHPIRSTPEGSRLLSMPAMSLDLALIVFARIERAEHAYASVLETSGAGPWVHELAFVEHHRHDRIVVRGPFAGRYVDVDDRGDVIGKRTAEGALTGGVAGLFFGPAGLAVGLVAGAAAGGLSEADHAAHLHDAFLDEI